MKSRTQARRRTGTKAAVLAATLEVLVNDGYVKLNSVRVAARAGVSRSGSGTFRDCRHAIDFRYWHIASIRRRTAHQSLLARSGHERVRKFCANRSEMTQMRTSATHPSHDRTPTGSVTVSATTVLTSVLISDTNVSESRPRAGRQPATPVAGASAVPAGGGSSPPLPGGSGELRPAGMMTGLRGNPLDWDRKERVTPAGDA